MAHSFFQYLKLKFIVAWLRLKRSLRAFLHPVSPISVHPGVAFQTVRLPSRDWPRKISVHSYQPIGRTNEKPHPVLINLHGSGFIYTNSLGKDREFCSLVAARTGITVLDADYRKAPEHPFPAPLHDFQDVLSYVRAHPRLYDPARILVSGFSAGGNLVLAGALADADPSRRITRPRIRAAITFYPSVDFTKPHVAPDAFEPGTGHAGQRISPKARDLFYECYLPPGTPPRSDPHISPLFGEVDRYPRWVYVACGSADALYTPCETLVRNLEGTIVPPDEESGEEKGAGRVVRFCGLQGEDHSFDKSAAVGTIAEQHKVECYQAALEVILEALA